MTDPMQRLQRATLIYLTCLAVGAAIATAAWLNGTSDVAPAAMLVAGLLALLLAVTLTTPLPFGPNAHQLLDSAVLLAAILILPPGLGVVVAAVGPLISMGLRPRSWPEAVFASAQSALQASCGLLALAATGWWSRSEPFGSPAFLLTVVTAGLSMHLINTAAVAGMIVTESGERPWSAWRRVLVPDPAEAAGLVAQWGLGLLAAIVADDHPWALILLVLPGALMLGSLDRHVKLRLLAEERLIDAARHDALTGLLNRAYFTERLEELLSKDASQCALLFLDLDRFKQINDTLGHEAGDHLLRAVAQRVRNATSPGDLVARLGGDEFVILLSPDPSRSQDVAERIRVALTAPVPLPVGSVTITSSIGIAFGGDQVRQADNLLRHADLALYRAKGAGRNAILVHDEAQQPVTGERALRTASAGGRSRRQPLTFLPHVGFADRRVLTLEATPMTGFPDAEMTHRAQDEDEAWEWNATVSFWTMLEACRAGQQWATTLDAPPAVAIRVEASQLTDSNVVAEVAAALDLSGMDPGRLNLHLSELSALLDVGLTSSVLRELAAMGVSIVLDEYGLGGVSISQLSAWPITAIHLDSALVTASRTSTGANAVVRAITRSAQELGIAVGAGGISTEDEARRLRDLGCSIGAGSFFGNAGTEVQIVARLAPLSPALSLAG